MLERIGDLYRYRVLIEVLVRRELKARYRGTMLGLLWSFINPLLLVAIYTVVFSIYMRMDMKNYPVFLLAGLLPWNCFITGLSEGTSSILSSAGIIKKVYLPSEIFPLVYVLSNAVHYLLSLPVLIGLALVVGMPISPVWAFLPLLLVIQLTFTYGVTLMTSALAVNYRDLLHIIPNLIMVLFFLTPIFYTPAAVPAAFKVLLDFNPMAGIVEMHHEIFYAGTAPTLAELGRATVIAVSTVFLGLVVFERRREYFAESI